jgi:hypothetical protein
MIACRKRAQLSGGRSIFSRCSVLSIPALLTHETESALVASYLLVRVRMQGFCKAEDV